MKQKSVWVDVDRTLERIRKSITTEENPNPTSQEVLFAAWPDHIKPEDFEQI